MASLLGQAFIRVRPDVSGFESEAERPLNQATARLSERMKLGFAAAGAAIGAALGKGVADNLDAGKANAKLAAQLNLSAKDAAKAGALAGSLFRDGYGENIDQVNEAIRRVVQDTGVRLGSTDFKPITQKVLGLAETFDQDLGGVTRAVGQMMRTGLAKDANQALDIIAAGFQNGADKSEDFADTLNEYSTQFRDLGLSGAEATGIIVQGLKAGARDSDIVADALKELNIRVQDGTAAEGLKQLRLNADQMAAAFGKGGPAAKAALDQITDRLRAVKDPTDRYRIAQQLLGTQSEDLSKALFAIDPSKATQGLGDLDGRAQKVADTMHSSTAASIETVKRRLQGLVSDGILKAYNGWQSLSDGQQQAAVTTAGIAAAVTVGGVALAKVASIARQAGSGIASAGRGIAAVGRAGAQFVGGARNINLAFRQSATLATRLGAATRSGATQIAAYARSAGATAVALGRTAAAHVRTAAVTAASTARTVAAAAVQRAIAAATRSWAVAQRALNLALISNPIGLVIVGLVALGAGLVLLYKKSETFRSVVQGAFRGVQAAFGWVLNAALGVYNWVKANWPLLLAILTGPIGLAVLGISKHWDSIKTGTADFVKGSLSKLSGFATGARDKAVSAWRGFKGKSVEWAADIAKWVSTRPGVFAGKLSALPGKLSDRAKAGWSAFKDKSVDWGVSIANWVRSRPGVFASSLSALPGKLRDRARDAWSRFHSTAKDKVADIVTWTKGVPGRLAGALGNLGAKLRDRIASGMRTVISFINTHVVGNLNKVTSKFGFKIPAIKYRFAEGGVLPGYAPRQDTLLAAVSPGEGVLVPETVRKLGGARVIHALNAWGRRGAPFPGLPAFADGGVVGTLKSLGSGALDLGKKVVGGIEKLLAKGASYAVRKLLNPVIDTFAKRFGTNFPAGFVTGVLRKLRDKAVAWGKEQDEMGGPVGNVGGGVRRWTNVVLQALRMVGQPASYLGITLRRMQQESGGNPRAVNLWDINARNGTPSVGLMQVISPTFRAYAGKMRGVGPFLYGVSINPLANVYASMRYALARYGSLPRAYNRRGGYDEGGVADGVGLLPKYTPKPERVLSPRQTAAFEELVSTLSSGQLAGGETHVHVYLDGHEIKSIVRTEVRRAHEQTATSVRYGRR